MLTKILEYTVKQLVDHPDQVNVVESTQESKIIVEIHVSPQDLKRVIGKDGRVVRALRTMVNNIDNLGPVELIVK